MNFNQKRGYYQTRGEEQEEDKTKKEEYYALRVVDVVDTNEKRGRDTWYDVHLENGFVYHCKSKEKPDWIGKIKEFVVTTQLNEDGSPKTDKDGKEDKAHVDDLVAVMKEMSQNGNKVIELGTVQSPEFLARAEIAAEKAGVTISNLAEKKKEMEERGLKYKVKEEKAIETTRSALGGVNIDVSTQEGLDHAVSKMEALVFIKDLPTKEYEEFKNSPDFKKLNLNDKEIKLFDNVNKLKNKGEFASQPEEKQARILGRMINNYVSSYANAKDNAKGNARKKQKAGREAAANFVKTNATRLGISNGGR